jgi:hypothetical protein
MEPPSATGITGPERVDVAIGLGCAPMDEARMDSGLDGITGVKWRTT